MPPSTTLRRSTNKSGAESASAKSKLHCGKSCVRLVVLLLVAVVFGINMTNLAHLTSYHEERDNHDEVQMILPVGKNHQGQEESNVRSKSNDKADHVYNYRHETEVFRQVLNRAESNLGSCDKLPRTTSAALPQLPSYTNTSNLPQFGIIDAINAWFNHSSGEARSYHQRLEKYKTAHHNSTCYLPPPTSCHVTAYSVIFMSHSTERLKTLTKGIADIARWKLAREIILVWNNQRHVLNNDPTTFGTQLVQWSSQSNHPLRIFYSFEMGLPNSLLNRYHPLIQPTNEAVLFFDDDGPFFTEDAMTVGFELWKRNSGVQVGCFPRNIRFMNPRMIRMQSEEVEFSIRQVKEGWQGVSPYNANAFKDEQGGDRGREQQHGHRHPKFIPRCHNNPNTNKGIDVLEYNFYVFPDFNAHIILPSGSFLHRDYLCFVFHPVFEAIRAYIEEHPTHPDDISISTIVSHLSGKAPRTFPRFLERGGGTLSDRVDIEEKKEKEKQEGGGGEGSKGTDDNKGKTLKRDDSTNVTRVKDGEMKNTTAAIPVSEDTRLKLVQAHVDKFHVAHNERHRKLLWQERKGGWGKIRGEAVNSVIGYFGGIHAGSVGWCVGTEYMRKDRGPIEYQCNVAKPSYDIIPWMNAGGLGHDQC